jgi:hypothetical protein
MDNIPKVTAKEHIQLDVTDDANHTKKTLADISPNPHLFLVKQISRLFLLVLLRTSLEGKKFCVFLAPIEVICIIGNQFKQRTSMDCGNQR